MKAWVLKTKNGKYVDSLNEDIDSKLNMATLWPTRKNAFREGLFFMDEFTEDLPKVKAVKVEIKEIKNDNGNS